jgi:hypothetical protein
VIITGRFVDSWKLCKQKKSEKKKAQKRVSIHISGIISEGSEGNDSVDSVQLMGVRTV